MLHITNGDHAADLIKDAVFTGQILAWRDVLHEGPVPCGLELQKLSEIRTKYIASKGWGNFHEIKSSFEERDNTLAKFREHEEIVLWFEHDLYDQLQLIQLLSWFYERERGATKLSLICIGEYPGIHPFHGLGQLNVNQIASLYPARRIISYKEMKIGYLAWHAFTSSNPTDIEKFLTTNHLALPFLRSALLRHLQQFPSALNGLSRSELQILAGVKEGQQTPQEIFSYHQSQEDPLFMGDWSLWSYIEGLCNGSVPLLRGVNGATFTAPNGDPPSTFHAQRVELTEAGEDVLAGNADAIQLNGIDRWLGGVHLQTGENEWRWDGVRLFRPNSSA